jgi:polysaccharide biosynthesis/export protein
MRSRAAFLVLMIALALSVASERPGAAQDIQSLPLIDYRIGARDLLQVTVFELPELNQTVRVMEDGSITLSVLGKIDVAGLTAQELEQKLAALVEEKVTTGGAHVTVFIQEYQKVAVIGAVNRPGMYEMVGPTNLLQMIAQAGGLSSQHMGELYVYRQENDGQQNRIVIKIDELIGAGRQDLNIMLEPKDVVTVPVDQTQNVFVFGEVRSPGAISFLASKKITLLQAIAQAGGPTEWAKLSNVFIKRKEKSTGKEIQIPVNLRNMISGRVFDLVLQEGDVVIVP